MRLFSRAMILTACLFLALSPAWAGQRSRTEKSPGGPMLTRLGFGVYRAGDVKGYKEARAVPLEKGLCFGLKMNVNIPGDEMITLKGHLTTPGHIDPKTGQVATSRDWTVDTAGGVRYEPFSFCFDHDYELVPGEYTLEYAAPDGQKVSQTFEAE